MNLIEAWKIANDQQRIIRSGVVVYKDRSLHSYLKPWYQGGLEIDDILADDWVIETRKRIWQGEWHQLYSRDALTKSLSFYPYNAKVTIEWEE